MIYRKHQALDPPGDTRPRRHESAFQQLPLPSRNQRRLDGVQMLRAVAVLSVAWIHAGQLCLLLGARSSLPDLGISGVDLFFVISGFILCLLTLRDPASTPGVRSSWKFLQRRIARIFPVYWIFALPLVVHHIHHGWAESKPYIPAFFLLPTNSYPELMTLANFSWTLIFEMFFYLLLACILLVSVRRAPQLLIALLVFFVVIGAAVGTHRPVLMVICNPIVLEFAFGALIAIVYFRSEAKPLRSPSSRIGWLLIVPGTLCGIVLGVTKPDWIAPFQNQILAGYGVMARVLTWGIACALVVAGVVFLAPSLKSRVGRIMLAIGNASYSTYLLSGMAVANMSRPFADFGKLHPTHSLPVLSVIQILIVTALTCVGLVLYQFIERPLIRRTYHLIARRDA